MSASAVEALIALSDAICPPLPQSSPIGHGNFFGPWLTDTKWSPRKPPVDSTVAARKKATPRSSSQVSKSLPRRLSLFTSPNINSSPYGAQRSSSPAGDNFVGKSKLKFTTKSKSFIASEGSKRQFKAKGAGCKESKFSTNNKGDDTEGDDGDEELGEEEEEDNRKRTVKHYQFQKPALPALITLTSNTSDTNSTFALGRQLELPLPKVYVSVGQKQSAKGTPRANSASLPLFSAKGQGSTDGIRSREITWQNSPYLNNNGQGRSLSHISSGATRDVSQCRAEALKRALEMRNPPPPTHEYEDISQHMRHYRIHCTVLGTGRFSLANETNERDVKPVQWQDLFPHRPLTAVGSVVDVPIFRFSVTDFRVQTAPSTKANRSTPPPLPRTATPRYLAPRDEVVRQETRPASLTNVVKDAKSSDDSSDSDEKAVAETIFPPLKDEANLKSGSVELEERFARASRIANVTVCEDKTRQDEKSKAHQQTEDNDYMLYLKAKNKAVKQPNRKQKVSLNSNDSKKMTKNTKFECKSENQGVEKKQSVVTAEVRSEDEEDEYFRHKTKLKTSKEPRVRKGSNFSCRKCEGQYGPTTKFFRSVTDLVSKGRLNTDTHQGATLPPQKLIVDADRLKESVEVKIDEGERKFRSSINEAVLSQIISSRNKNRLWQKIHRRDASFPNATTLKNIPTKISIQPLQDGADDDSSENIADSKTYNNFNSVIDSDEDDNNDNNFEGKRGNYPDEIDTSDDLPGKKNISLVTSYDFKGYVEALRAKTERYLDNKSEEGDGKKLSDDDDETSPVSFVVSRKRNWRPKESRVRSAAKGGKYRTSDVRSKSRDSASDDLEGFPRNSTSARLRYKPTSPATSAFVIAAPPNSKTTGIGGRSVVLPLEEFMEMAVDGKDQSFADWKTCLNNASPGLMSRPQVSAGQKSRSDGLLKVVSFATPVNQFIFAKKITFDSTENLGIFPFNNKKKKRLEDGRSELSEKAGGSSRYRLKLSDFGLPRSFRKKSAGQEDSEIVSGKLDEKSRIGSHEKSDEPNEKVEDCDKPEQDRFEKQRSSIVDVCSWVNSKRPDYKNEIDDFAQSKEKKENKTKLPDSHTKKETHGSSTRGIVFNANDKSKESRNRSVSAEAHACLRKEILRLMEHRKSTTVKEKDDIDLGLACVEGRKNWLGNTTIKEMPLSNTLGEMDEKVKEDVSTQQAIVASSPDATGAFTFRFNRQSSSLSPRRLTLKHRPRRCSERERSLSPSRIHGYFHRRRSTLEVRQDDPDLNLPPLTIQGGGISRPSSERPEAKVDLATDSTSKSERVEESDSSGTREKSTQEVKKLSQREKEASTHSSLISPTFLETAGKGFACFNSDVKIRKDAGSAEELALPGVEKPARREAQASKNIGIDKAAEDKENSSDILRESQASPKKATKYVRFSVDM